MLFPHPLIEALRQAPDTPAFEHAGRTVTRAELLELIRRLAGALREAGLGPGRAIAVRTEVTPEAFAAHMAAHALGCRVVGIRPGYPPGQLAHVLAMDVDAVLVDPATATPRLMTGRALSLGPVPGAADLLARPDDGGPLEPTARPDDVAALTFTSGSTGRPKGCAITYRALSEHWAWQPRVWSPVAAAFARGFERYLLFGTLASMVVMEFLAPCLLGGGTAVIPEDDGRPMFPYTIERYRITGSIITVPRLFRMLELVDTADVSSLRALMVSGSPIGPRRLRAAAARLGPVVYQGYGQTEAGNVAMLTPEHIAAGIVAPVGLPHPGVELSVRDEAGAEVPPGRTGEIHVRSPYVMAGYWGDEAETRDTLRDGWLRTRDLGHVDAGGFLHLEGRSRDVVMVNAMVVYAGPIERVLTGHPDVDEAYVVGAPDEGTGEAVHAFVVPAPGRVPDQGALAARVRAELGEDSVPKTITVVPGVPVATSGKPDKRALLAEHGSGLF
ncbi:acyl-CoA synthetase (AMP-forming)/AMP-acid ligase II [Nonomuraea thailandensis]|uniref:Acyl-CoA synthetase (AMP-forming)/AMP-acid ligase II n=1 Tax=Nonomuraea thailandensis TaxID=1188745 RepID=A0A9X2GCR9_9ACTN|nr:AMP-binding protein [Nonomuraea thailandensis]MCP2355009.1 acyl-CoA synthetase (AMP-forming)/AMP-acid ligase II [Nonomuraea thailandensis]